MRLLRSSTGTGVGRPRTSSHPRASRRCAKGAAHQLGAWPLRLPSPPRGTPRALLPTLIPQGPLGRRRQLRP
eukprot:3759872-Prorocentrum_lima.AAC.1